MSTVGRPELPAWRIKLSCKDHRDGLGIEVDDGKIGAGVWAAREVKISPRGLVRLRDVAVVGNHGVANRQMRRTVTSIHQL